jgi:hypothetical protein
MTEFEKQCYGMSEGAIRSVYMKGFTAKMSGLEMVVMGILSDAQELISCDHKQALDQARMELNRAKFILSTMMEDKLAAANSKKIHSII